MNKYNNCDTYSKEWVDYASGCDYDMGGVIYGYK